MQKYFILIVSVLFVTAATVGCKSDRLSEPEDIGMYVFEILTGFDDITKEEFADNFITVNDLKRVVRNSDLSSDEIKIIIDDIDDNIDEVHEERNEDIFADYNRIERAGERYEIVWSEIEFVEFNYDTEDEDGFIFCGGDLYFLYDDDKFRISIEALFVGRQYRVAEIYGLRKV